MKTQIHVEMCAHTWQFISKSDTISCNSNTETACRSTRSPSTADTETALEEVASWWNACNLHLGNFLVDLCRIRALRVRVLSGENLENAHAESIYVNLFGVLLLVQFWSHELRSAWGEHVFSREQCWKINLPHLKIFLLPVQLSLHRFRAIKSCVTKKNVIFVQKCSERLGGEDRFRSWLQMLAGTNHACTKTARPYGSKRPLAGAF